MKEKIATIKANSIKEISSCENLKELSDLKVKYLGKKGELTAILRGMGALQPEERPIIGELVNQVRDELELNIKKREKQLKRREMEKRLESENIDVTEPSKKIELGSLHPITQIINEVEEIFLGMGYKIADGPEVEKAIGKSGEKEEMGSLMLLNFYSNRDKGYKVTAYFDKLNNSKCKTKKLSYDKSTLNEDLGKETISFNNFDKIKEQKEKSSLNYYLKHSKEFDKEYKTLEEYKLDNMIYLSDIKENLGDEGIEIEKEIYLENIREKYLFADKNSNYIIVYVQENNIFSMEGNVNGEEIDWNII